MIENNKPPLGFYFILGACVCNVFIAVAGNAAFLSKILSVSESSELQRLSLAYILAGIVILFIQLISCILFFNHQRFSRNVFILCALFSVLHFSFQIIYDVILGKKYFAASATAPLYLIENIIFVAYVFRPGIRAYLYKESFISKEFQKFIFITSFIGLIIPFAFRLAELHVSAERLSYFMPFWPTAFILMFGRFTQPLFFLSWLLFAVSIIGNILCYAIMGHVIYSVMHVSRLHR